MIFYVLQRQVTILSTDTERLYTDVQESILASYGKSFDWSLKAKMMGKKALEAAKIFVNETGLDDVLTPEEFIEKREMMLHSLFPESEILPGVERLIRHFHTHQIPMAVATSSHKYHYELKTMKHKEIFSFMHHVVVGDDTEVKHGKPAPDIFLVAASRFKVAPVSSKNILVFEDAPNGVAAARTAGMSVVMVPDPNLDRSLCMGADQILGSLLDFKPSDWGLPEFSH
ncbi:hypothetical protein KP509_03G074200 [Ceratopteris richardii]|uniref:glycerol-1-phosphatase n=1 Tax=Ceratopteris richardii TaxID=49495 RepID=A0A8T2V8N1_CERRI|nr:hypothetical protein KP509_03G074200 [Ceratopteris richardii]